MRRPGNGNRTSTQAISRPNGAAKAAETTAPPKLSSSAAATRGCNSACSTGVSPNSHGRITSAASGTTTIRPSQITLMPKHTGKPGSALGATQRVRTALIARLLLGWRAGRDLIEHPAIAELGRLGGFPAAEAADVKGLDFRERRRELRRHRRITRAVEMLGHQFLARLGPEVVQVGIPPATGRPCDRPRYPPRPPALLPEC